MLMDAIAAEVPETASSAAPAFLARWPSDDRPSRLVFIARDLPREFAEALLDAIEAEVRETISNA